MRLIHCDEIEKKWALSFHSTSCDTDRAEVGFLDKGGYLHGIDRPTRLGQ